MICQATTKSDQTKQRLPDFGLLHLRVKLVNLYDNAATRHEGSPA